MAASQHDTSPERQQALATMARALVPAFDGRAFALADACVAAVHYGGCYEGMDDFSFGMLRQDFDARRDGIVTCAREAGFTVRDDVVTPHGAHHKRPYLSIGTCAHGAPTTGQSTAGAHAGAADTWMHVYPLDTIPRQVTLRFRVFSQAARAMKRFRAMQAADDFGAMAAFEAQFARACRYDGMSTGFVSNLAGRGKADKMGERTVFQRSIATQDLFPVRMMPFAGTAIPVARDVSNWTLEMTPQRTNVIELIQRESLQSLEALDGACETLGLTYFLVGGSMLGAVRDGGFIAWDDDTDVGMLRKDYAAFCREAPAVLGPDGYFVQLPRTDTHIHFVYARLRKDGVQYITYYNADKQFHRGVWVDVFPFDARPRNERLARLQRLGANTFARASMALKRRREYVEADFETDMGDVPAEDMRYLKRFRLVSRFFPVALCRWGYHACARFFNPFLAGRPHTLYASFVPSYTTISADELLPVRRVPYSGAELAIPHDAEAFLTRQYGDYLALPPVHERYSEHGFKCLLDAEGNPLEVSGRGERP